LSCDIFRRTFFKSAVIVTINEKKGKIMNKKEMVKLLSEKMEITQSETKELLDSTFDILSDLLAKGYSFNVQNFGTFSVSELDKRKGFNPLLNKWMMLPQKLKPRFKASDALKERVNKV
jgi:nucleoid DNA-binding protein